MPRRGLHLRLPVAPASAGGATGRVRVRPDLRLRGLGKRLPVRAGEGRGL